MALSGRLKTRTLSVLLLSVLICHPGRGSLEERRAPTTAPPRLMILYATCSLNKSYLSPYNSTASYTPNIDRFARRSMVFTKHTTEAGGSGTAFASILSGSQAHRHAVYVHPKNLYLIPEAYRDAGYDTFFWSNHALASADLNYGQGIAPRHVFRSVLTGDSARFQILQALKRDRDYRAFVMTNFTVTHAPYSTSWLGAFEKRFPAEAKGSTQREIERYYPVHLANRHEVQYDFPETVKRLGFSRGDIDRLASVLDPAYKSNVWHLDGLFGEVFAEVERAGLLDESVIAFTCDHAEVLYREERAVQVDTWRTAGSGDPERAADRVVARDHRCEETMLRQDL